MSLGLVFPAVTCAGDSGSAQQRLEALRAELETFHARFVQTVHEPDGQLAEQGQGEVWLKRPDLFRWEYGGEFPELIVADGQRVWIYDKALEQVTVQEQTGLAADSPLLLLLEPGSLEQQFASRELGVRDGLQLLELTALSRDVEFERVILGLQEERLAMMVLEDAFGMRTELRFTDVRKNLELEDHLFEFRPPDGVDVIGEIEPGGQAHSP